LIAGGIMRSNVNGRRGGVNGELTALLILLTTIATGMTPVEIKRDYGNAVVTITTYSAAEDALGLGSGFIVDPSGVIVTCYHVISGAYPAVVKLLNGASFQDIWVLGCDSVKDVAVIKVRGHGLTAATLGNSDSIEVGERVVAIGNPKGLESGIRNDDDYTLLQISAPISPGSSGGPVFDSSGKVIGIAAATLRDGQNLNFCVPIKYARPYADLEPSLTLEAFSRGARTAGSPPADASPTLVRNQFLQACVGPLRDFYGVLAWMANQEKEAKSAPSTDLLVAKEKVLRARVRMQSLATTNPELGRIQTGYLDAMQRVADGYGMSASGYAARNSYDRDAGYAKFVGATDDIERAGGLTEQLALAFLETGATSADTATRLPPAFDSLPAEFVLAVRAKAKEDSSRCGLHCIAESSSAKWFGFMPDLWLPGIVVDSVFGGSPAKRVGLRSGDVMVRVADTLLLRNMWDWYAFAAGHPIGVPFRLDVLRAAKMVQLKGKFAARPK
jgi:S1-C subfamily serine protease